MYLFVIGTRPEAIKMCPLIMEFNKRNLPCKLCITGQHKELLNDVLEFFQIKADFNLNIMKLNQTITYILTSIIDGIDSLLKTEKIDYVFVHGDTTSALGAALAAFYNSIKIVHIEAGLRTVSLSSPFPEEANRRLISAIATLSFCPTEKNHENLVKENNGSCKFVVGNTVIDALTYAQSLLKVKERIEPYVLLTTHRRENIGENMRSIFRAVDYLSKKHKMKFIFPMHPNPLIKKAYELVIKENDLINVIPPQNYKDFTELMVNASIIITDSGGIQEEASFLQKPLLILRNETERPEVLESNGVILCGTKYENIIQSFDKLTELKNHDYISFNLQNRQSVSAIIADIMIKQAGH